MKQGCADKLTVVLDDAMAALDMCHCHCCFLQGERGTIGIQPLAEMQLGISKFAASSDLFAGGAHLASKSLHRLQAGDNYGQHSANSSVRMATQPKQDLRP